MMDRLEVERAPSPALIAERYEVIKPLGQGGMARVYHVFDTATCRDLALKQFVPTHDKHNSTVLTFFEAEYQVLAQLSHPRVIEVYDYGHSELGPFYTMELLEGADLAQRAPLPWRQACALVYDVCSSLALLHSRRLVHRDVSPRNVRCTRDGHAKLIDFGTMVPMGQSNVVAGTPAFVAPEVANRSALDGRADLFSLGATLYYALTKRPAFHARDFNHLAAAWSHKPPPPSSVDSDIPAALDVLVSGLLSLDPAMRPRSAFEVMQRLSAIAGFEREEPLVSQAYLTTPTLVARQGALSTFARALERAETGRGSALLIRAASGLGRSRLLDACVLEAKTVGPVVLRAHATAAAGGSLAVAQTLAEQLLEGLGAPAIESAKGTGTDALLFQPAAAPADDDGAPQARSFLPLRLRRFQDEPERAADFVDALRRWFIRASERRILLIAVDDMQRCDERSASLLAALAAEAHRRRMLLVLSAEHGESEAVSVLAQYCQVVALEPLSPEQTTELLSSVFGTVPNLGVLSESVFKIARGNPRDTMDVTQHLVEQGVLRYSAGSWTLPQHIEPKALSFNADDALRERLGALSPLARRLVEAHALASFDNLTRGDYAALQPDEPAHSVDRALAQLLSQQVLLHDGGHYVLAHRHWGDLLSAALDDARRRERHRALARSYEQSRPFAAGRHLLLAGEGERGLMMAYTFLQATSQNVTTLWERTGGMRPKDLIETLELAHAAAVEHARPRRERIVTAGWLVAISIIHDEAYFYRYADEWRTQLEHDSGLTLYRELEDITDPNQRLMRALTLLSERYAATPEADRAYSPEEGIRLLAIYVGVAIATGSRAHHRGLLTTLPQLLEPFTALSPLLEAVRINAMASCDLSGDGRLGRARERWIEVLDKLSGIDATQLPAIVAFRCAIAHALGLVEVRMGLASAEKWIELLDGDPLHRVSAMYLRKVLCLNRGDFEGAERWRQQAEILALQTPMRQMFSSMVMAELWAHAAANDLVGVQQALERIAPLAKRYPAWVSFELLAQAQFQSVRGDVEGAIAGFERCLEACAPDPTDPDRTIAAWPSCVGSYVDALLRAGLYTKARDVAHGALQTCESLELGTVSHEVARGLALAEARLGDHARAFARLEALIEIETALGVRGLQLGAHYEACTRVAIWAGDEERLQRYARLTAIEYRYGHGSPLGARYERLMDEARRSGVAALPDLADFVSTAMVSSRFAADPITRVSETMVGAGSRRQRAQRALRMLCEARGADAGYLYLCCGREITLAAATDGAEEPTGLRPFLAERFRAEDECADAGTAIVTEEEATTDARSTSWTDTTGNAHQPLVLMGTIDGESRAIGIASFVVRNEASRRPLDAQLNAAVAAFLIEAGDVQLS